MNKKLISAPKLFKEIVYPFMEKDGFHQLTTKIYAKIVDGELLQFLILSVKTGIRKEYFIEYGTMFLSEQKENFIMTLGRKAQKMSSGGYYSAFSEKALNQAMQWTLLAYQEEISPFFQSTNSIDKYIQEYQKEIKIYPRLHHAGHVNKKLSCLHLVKNNLQPALDFAKKSLEAYQEESQNEHSKEWAEFGINSTQKLIRSIELNTYSE